MLWVGNSMLRFSTHFASLSRHVSALYAGSEEGKKDVAAANGKGKLTRKAYEEKLTRLQVELVRLQEWTKHKKAKILVIFEGRDTAGKGGVIKRITERVSPRVFRVAALPTPTEREKTQMYFQRYVQHLPAGGEIVLFDRSWYNRSGVERVMGFCSDDEYEEFMRVCPGFELSLVRSGIRSRRGKAGAKQRLPSRIPDPLSSPHRPPDALQQLGQHDR